MILREIELDFPYAWGVQKEYSSDEERRMDYQLNWKWNRRKYSLMNQCMASMISRILPKMTTKDCWKITIICGEKPSRNKLLIVGGVLEVEVPFDLSMFLEMDSLSKKKYTISKIREAIGFIAQKDFFDVSEIEKACDRAEELNYANEWYWKKPLKRKHMSVQLKVLHEVECVILSMVFTDSATNSSKEVFLLSDTPDEWVFTKYFGKLEWISDDTARLTAKTGEQFTATYK